MNPSNNTRPSLRFWCFYTTSINLFVKPLLLTLATQMPFQNKILDIITVFLSFLLVPISWKMVSILWFSHKRKYLFLFGLYITKMLSTIKHTDTHTHYTYTHTYPSLMSLSNKVTLLLTVIWRPRLLPPCETTMEKNHGEINTVFLRWISSLYMWIMQWCGESVCQLKRILDKEKRHSDLLSSQFRIKVTPFEKYF